VFGIFDNFTRFLAPSAGQMRILLRNRRIQTVCATPVSQPAAVPPQPLANLASDKKLAP